MSEKNLEKLCRFAKVKDHRRGIYGMCSKTKKECVGNIWYPTGHGGDDSYIDFAKVEACESRSYRK